MHLQIHAALQVEEQVQFRCSRVLTEPPYWGQASLTKWTPCLDLLWVYSVLLHWWLIRHPDSQDDSRLYRSLGHVTLSDHRHERKSIADQHRHSLHLCRLKRTRDEVVWRDSSFHLRPAPLCPWASWQWRTRDTPQYCDLGGFLVLLLLSRGGNRNSIHSIFPTL